MTVEQPPELDLDEGDLQPRPGEVVFGCVHFTKPYAGAVHFWKIQTGNLGTVTTPDGRTLTGRFVTLCPTCHIECLSKPLSDPRHFARCDTEWTQQMADQTAAGEMISIAKPRPLLN